MESSDAGKVRFPLKKRIGVIDDDGITLDFLRKNLEGRGYEVLVWRRIPRDLAELEGCCVLIVDGDGIGNGVYRNGVDFLKEYVWLRRESKMDWGNRYVHYSGFVSRKDFDLLEGMGVSVYDKMCSPHDFVDVIEEMAKTVECGDGNEHKGV